MVAEGGREGDQEGGQEMVEVEESEEVQMVDTGTVKQWEVVFSRLQSINQESHLLVIDKVTPPLVPEVTMSLCQVVTQILSLNSSTLSYWWRGGMVLSR